MEIEVVRPQELQATLVERWAALQAADPAFDSPFLSPHWARAVERAQGPDRGVRAAVLRQDGQAVGFLSAKVGAFSAMPAGAPMCDYQGVVCEPGLAFDPRAVVQALGVGRFDFCHMLGSQAPFAQHAQGSHTSFIVDVAGGYEAYAEARREAGSGFLKDLDKKRRKAERDHGEVKFTAFSRSKADFDQLIEWKRERFRETGQTDIFAASWPARLTRELFASRDPDFGGVLFTLHIDGRLAAAHFHLRGQRTIHAWLIGHEPEFDRVSPGLLLFQDIARWMDDAPYSRLDLGGGDYRFKRELANAGQDVLHGFVGVPSPAALVRSAAYGVRKAAEALPLGPVSDLPGKAMRRLDLLRGLR